MTPSNRIGSNAARLVLLTTSVLLTLSMFEIGFRIVAFHDDRELDALGHGESIVSDPETKVRTKDIIRIADNRRIIYELVPGLRATYKGAILSVNEEGFRGPVVSRTRTERVVRIAGIGDSVMFGYGVGDEDYYLHLLRETLSERRPEASWEVINGAVPGYNSVMEVEAFKEKLVAYDPDLVVIEYVPNDLDLPNFIRNRSPYFSTDRSFLWSRIRAFKNGLGRIADDRLARPPDDVPAEYSDMVGIEAYRSSMIELARLRDDTGFRLFMLCHLRCPVEVKSIAEDLGVSYAEEYGAIEAQLRTLGKSMTDYAGSELTVSDEDHHPSRLGHRVIADLLYARLEEGGFLDELVARRVGTEP